MSTKIKLILYLIIAIAVIAYCYIQSIKGGDFRVYLGASELLKNGKSCYNVWIDVGNNNACGYSYSPFFATILIPFTYIDEPFPQFIWLLLNVFFLYRIIIIIKNYLPISTLSIKNQFIWVTIIIALTVRFLLNNFEMVQMTIFLLYVCLESIYFSDRKSFFLSGLILALGIIIKILPIVLIPYLLYRKKFKPVLVTFLCLFIFLIFPGLIFGWSFNIQLISEWISTLNPLNTEFNVNQNLYGDGIHSFSGFFAAYFTDINNKISIPYNRTLINLNENSLFILTNSFRIIFIGLTLYFLKTFPFKNSINNIHKFWELSYIFAITPLIFPHQQKYNFFFIFPAVAYLSYYILVVRNKKNISNKKYILIIVLLIASFFLMTFTTDGIIGKHLSKISQYYKTITFGVLLIIISLTISNPKKINNLNL